ncbi:hypothetical protein DFH06DRAFT_1198355 [Mycena polygramma]|nr:hypothetical protein DFH06DRAFT_1198355 [Mycena polygramma]
MARASAETYSLSPMTALRRATHTSVRSLDASAPALKIISPTPRTFTFPPAHNLADSPFSSPCSSPFELDLRRGIDSSSAPAPPQSTVFPDYDGPHAPLPLSAFTRTLFPESPVTTSLPAPQTPDDSTSNTLVDTVEERRPKKGDEGYVKRPENAFFLFRRECALSLSSSSPSAALPGLSSARAVPPLRKQRQADLSKTISHRWKALSPEERAYWDGLAKEKKHQHEALHPNYVYRPARRPGAKSRSKASDTVASALATPGERKSSVPPPQLIEFVLPARAHSRSSSAPTSPPYQTYHIPDLRAEVHTDASSHDVGVDDPTSLMDLISQFGTGSGNGFDYTPSNLGSVGTLEVRYLAVLIPSDFLRAMFPPIAPPPSDTMRFPASSTGGLGPATQYTSACTSFHPSVFTSTSAAHASCQSSSEILLDEQQGNSSEEMTHGYEQQNPGAQYSPYASSWAASSPWACASMQMQSGIVEGDFDIGRVPKLELDRALGHVGFPATDFSVIEGEGEMSFDDMMAEAQSMA